MHYRRMDLIESIDCIRYAQTTYWSFRTEQHKEKKKKSSRLGKKRDSETLSHLFYVSLEGSRTSVLPNSMIRIMEKGEVFKKTYIPTSLYLRFPKGEISQQKCGSPHKERVSARVRDFKTRFEDRRHEGV